MTPEEMQAEILRLTDENKTIKTSLDTAKAEATEKEKRITELQEHNQKLFLKLTDTKTKENTEEGGENTFEKLFEIIKGGK